MPPPLLLPCRNIVLKLQKHFVDLDASPSTAVSRYWGRSVLSLSVFSASWTPLWTKVRLQFVSVQSRVAKKEFTVQVLHIVDGLLTFTIKGTWKVSEYCFDPFCAMELHPHISFSCNIFILFTHVFFYSPSAGRSEIRFSSNAARIDGFSRTLCLLKWLLLFGFIFFHHFNNAWTEVCYMKYPFSLADLDLPCVTTQNQNTLPP